MAVEQSGTQAGPDPDQLAPAAEATSAGSAPADTAPADTASADTAAADAKPDFDELKRKFREALDRKRGDHASAEGAHDTGKVHGSHGPAVSRRSFRRKSGG